jgi:hypothetical protein
MRVGLLLEGRGLLRRLPEHLRLPSANYPMCAEQHPHVRSNRRELRQRRPLAPAEHEGEELLDLLEVHAVLFGEHRLLLQRLHTQQVRRRLRVRIRQ